MDILFSHLKKCLKLHESSLFIAKEKKSHIIGDTFVKLWLSKETDIILGTHSRQQLSQIPHCFHCNICCYLEVFKQKSLGAPGLYHCGVQLVTSFPYTPYLASNDFFLLPKSKKSLFGKRFSTANAKGTFKTWVNRF